MNKTVMESLSVRVPSSEKKLFGRTARRNGTDVAAALRTFIHAFNVEGGYPFDTTRYYPVDAEEETEIAMLKAQLRAGTLKGYSSHKELRKDAGR